VTACLIISGSAHVLATSWPLRVYPAGCGGNSAHTPGR